MTTLPGLNLIPLSAYPDTPTSGPLWGQAVRKMRDGLTTAMPTSVIAAAAVGDGIADDYGPLMDARDAAGVNGVVQLDAKTAAGAPAIYRHTQKIEPLAGQRWAGMGTGRLLSGPQLFYDGPADATLAQIHVPAGVHGVNVERLRFNANAKAGMCVWVEGVNGSATHRPTVADCHFEGYTSRGAVFGGNSTTLTNSVQLQIAHLLRCSWHGGTAGAIGLLLNAQNCEWLVVDAPYFDPAVGSEHLNHIFALRGGMYVRAMLSTRATAYAVEANEQMVIDGWRTEDQFLIHTNSIDPGGPHALKNVNHRSGSAVWSDVTIDLRHINKPMAFDNVRCLGSVNLGATNPVHVKGEGVYFENAGSGAGWIFGGPQNQRGIYHVIDTGDYILKGTAPKFHLELNNSSQDLVTLDSQGVWAPSGSASTPSHTFVADGDTGLFDHAANQPAMAAGGTEVARWQATGAADEMCLWLYDPTAAALVRVKRGASDSGGTGRRSLTVPN